MQKIKDKLNKIEKKINEKKIIQKKLDLKFKEQNKKAEKEINKIWKREFENNKDFINSLNKILSTFKKLDKNNKYEYTIIGEYREFGSSDMRQIKFVLGIISVEIWIPIMMGTNIQLYVNENIYAQGIDYNPKHLRNFRLEDTQNAKEFYFDKILEIFEVMQNKY